MTVLLTLTSDNSANFDRILQKHTSFDSPLKALLKVFWDQMDTVTHSAANECPVPPVCVTFWVIHRPSIQVTFVTMCVNAGQLLASWFASLSWPSHMFQTAHCSRVSFEFISMESWRAAWFIVNRKNCHCKDTMGHRSMHCHLSRFSSIWIWLWLKMAKRNVERTPSIYSERMKRTTWREAKIYRIVISWQIKWIYANGRSFFFSTTSLLLSSDSHLSTGQMFVIISGIWIATWRHLASGRLFRDIFRLINALRQHLTVKHGGRCDFTCHSYLWILT